MTWSISVLQLPSDSVTQYVLSSTGSSHPTIERIDTFGIAMVLGEMLGQNCGLLGLQIGHIVKKLGHIMEALGVVNLLPCLSLQVCYPCGGRCGNHGHQPAHQHGCGWVRSTQLSDPCSHEAPALASE